MSDHARNYDEWIELQASLRPKFRHIRKVPEHMRVEAPRKRAPRPVLLHSFRELAAKLRGRRL